MRSRKLIAALLFALALTACGPQAREITNTGRGVNGSSVVLAQYPGSTSAEGGYVLEEHEGEGGEHGEGGETP